MFDKLKFWKKKDDFAGLSDININTGMGQTDPYGGHQQSFGHDPYGQPRHDPYSQQQGNQFGQPHSDPFGSNQQNFDVHPVQGSTNFAGGAGGGNMEKDLEIISAKLDALKSALESINQRLAHIEHIASQDDPQQRKKTWY
ncbi:hypothetical protein COV93_05210 [Candidatus Woesearchaeota archaeon CG11_big_fil_rev_8_21_14_0_20_43_8]|nr:MAG: hypothetical protein COV93_05210 [Candidatus Woesearchaeota archaeon CG11_big_fil_rev_8_21_14_0_20_43_8]PIO05443.1 MAG: hypothetical protein COT47_04780 [Candidatus Woesearchaeota archaeon CG08_land_8_20_14_0_20_43_7]